MRHDPVIDEIRKIRHDISAEHDHDPRKLVEHCIKLQEQYKERLIPPRKGPREAAEQRCC